MTPSMKKHLLSLLLLLIPALAGAANQHAKNIILFLGDAGGIPTLHAASLFEHDRPQSLFLQSLPHLALADTSSLNSWTTDSAAGMTAIVTGHKTLNGWLSLLPPEKDGEENRPLKTLLEYAEERGLSTGVVTNVGIWDATPAACYAHVSSRKDIADIFHQALHPRFGDGPDFLVGTGLKKLTEALATDAGGVEKMLRDAHYQVYARPSDIPSDATRAASIYDGKDFPPEPVVLGIIQSLARNPKGFFLMVEWDMHVDQKNPKKGLKRALVMDDLIRRVVAEAPPDTLILYAADHSLNFRLVRGDRNKPFAAQLDAQFSAVSEAPSTEPLVALGSEHSGEDVLIAATGPGAERLHGFIPNTQLFNLMMDAYGWNKTP